MCFQCCSNSWLPVQSFDSEKFQFRVDLEALQPYTVPGGDNRKDKSLPTITTCNVDGIGNFFRAKLDRGTLKRGWIEHDTCAKHQATKEIAHALSLLDHMSFCCKRHLAFG